VCQYHFQQLRSPSFLKTQLQLQAVCALRYMCKHIADNARCISLRYVRQKGCKQQKWHSRSLKVTGNGAIRTWTTDRLTDSERDWPRYSLCCDKPLALAIVRHGPIIITVISVVTVAGICNSVGGGVFWQWHRGGGAEYRSVSRLEWLIGNRWMSVSHRSGWPGMR